MGNNNIETLLPIYREFTDKEKLAWITQQFRDLETRYKEVVWQNCNLINKNKRLLQKIREDEAEVPSTLSGSDTVRAKAYLKLNKHYKAMTDRFWEVNDELLKLKEKNKEEKL